VKHNIDGIVEQLQDWIAARIAHPLWIWHE
jgi:hypothetical protein